MSPSTSQTNLFKTRLHVFTNATLTIRKGRPNDDDIIIEQEAQLSKPRDAPCHLNIFLILVLRLGVKSTQLRFCVTKVFCPESAEPFYDFS